MVWKEEAEKITNSRSKNNIDIDFVLIAKNNTRDSNSLGIAASPGGNRHRQKNAEESNEELTNC